MRFSYRAYFSHSSACCCCCRLTRCVWANVSVSNSLNNAFISINRHFNSDSILFNHNPFPSYLFILMILLSLLSWATRCRYTRCVIFCVCVDSWIFVRVFERIAWRDKDYCQFGKPLFFSEWQDNALENTVNVQNNYHSLIIITLCLLESLSRPYFSC